MSTPTTATATIPHSHYHHPSHHHFPYYTNTPSTSYHNRSAANHLLPSSSRLAPSYPASTSNSNSNSNSNSTSSYVPSSSTQASSTTINGSSFSSNSSLARSQRQDVTELPPILSDDNYTTMPPASKGSARAPSSPHSSKKRRRNSPVDWNKFYGAKPPREIIVIDDTPEPESAAVSAVSASQTLTNGSTAYSYTNGNGTGSAVNANTSVPRHAAKRRKRDDVAPATSGTRYDPVHHSRLNASTTTPRQNGTPSASTISSDRTNSANNTTAATSLGSLSSNGQYDHEVQAGQKRKRTRREVANEVKRRETAIVGHNYPSYHPPPQPPKKAGDVHVRVIPEVSSVRRPNSQRTNPLITLQAHKNRAVDDNDGHYVVVPEEDLTDNCSSSPVLTRNTSGLLIIFSRSNAQNARPGYFRQSRPGSRQETERTGCRQDHSVGSEVQRRFENRTPRSGYSQSKRCRESKPMHPPA